MHYVVILVFVWSIGGHCESNAGTGLLQDPQDPDFIKQLDNLRSLFYDEAIILEPVAMGSTIPKQADAVVFPQMLGEAYKCLADFKALDLPILVITSDSVVEGSLEFYAQFENSDCLNGAVIRVPNGQRTLKDLASHHYILTSGRNLPELEGLAQVFEMSCRVLA